MQGINSVDQQAVDTVRMHVQRGDTVFIGQNHLGRAKIKIRYGPFKLLTKRLEVSSETLDQIKTILRSQR